MSKVKEIFVFNDGSWGAATSLGADDANVDITTATTNPSSDTTNTLAGLTDANVTVAASANDTDASAWTKFNRFRQRVVNVLGNYITLDNLSSYISKNDVVTTGLNGDSVVPADNTTTVYSASTIYKLMKNVIGTDYTEEFSNVGYLATIIEAMKKHCYSGVMDFTDVFDMPYDASTKILTRNSQLIYVPGRAYVHYFGHTAEEHVTGSLGTQDIGYFQGVAFITALFQVRSLYTSAPSSINELQSNQIATLKDTTILLTATDEEEDVQLEPIIMPISEGSGVYLYELPNAGTVDSYIPGQNTSTPFRQPVNLWFRREENSDEIKLRIMNNLEYVQNNGWLRLNFSFPFKTMLWQTAPSYNPGFDPIFGS